MAIPQSSLESPPRPSSPVGLLVADERTNALLIRLAGQVEAMRRADSLGRSAPMLSLSRGEIMYARNQWEQGVLAGEHGLTNLALLLAARVLRTNQLQVVARVVAGYREEEQGRLIDRIVIEETLDRERLNEYGDYNLARNIVDRYRYRGTDTEPFRKLFPRASLLQYRPLEARENALASRVMSRVKTNFQIWNKVCDAIFDIDRIAERDKQLNSRSKYIKDIFGLKLLTQDSKASYTLEAFLGSLEFSESELASCGLSGPQYARLELVERKDYLAVKKQTGWAALKNVYRWGGQVFEVQIQTQANYWLEEWDLSRASHRTFEMQRRLLRRDLEERVAHYREFRRLLKAIFSERPRTSSEVPSWLELVD